MTWMIFALAGAFFWALVHHLDKLLLTRFAASYGVGSIVIVSSLFPLFLLPVLLFITGSTPLFVPIGTALTLITAGLLGAIAALFYFYSLEGEETTVVVSVYQLSPVFGYLLGLAFLGEILTTNQVIGSIVTILGVAMLSFEFREEKRVRIRKRTMTLMTIAAFTFALGDVLYKGAAVGEFTYLTSMFWIFAGYVMFGIAALISVKQYRDNFLSVVRQRNGTVLALSALNETFQTGGVMFTAYALLLAPVALVLVVDSYQPVFVFALGIIFTLIAPKLVQEKISVRHFLHKTTAIAIAVLGTILMQQI